MYKSILISSDSTCDLSPELVERYQIRIQPMGVTEEALPEGFGIDEDSPEGIMLDFDDADSDADAYGDDE